MNQAFIAFEEPSLDTSSSSFSFISEAQKRDEFEVGVNR